MVSFCWFEEKNWGIKRMKCYFKVERNTLYRIKMSSTKLESVLLCINTIFVSECDNACMLENKRVSNLI